jgi:hypothetical protein
MGMQILTCLLDTYINLSWTQTQAFPLASRFIWKLLQRAKETKLWQEIISQMQRWSEKQEGVVLYVELIDAESTYERMLHLVLPWEIILHIWNLDNNMKYN